MSETPLELIDAIRSCESEPLHLSGAIQSFGALLVVAGDGCISHASENLAALTGTAAASVLGQPLSCCPWLPPAAFDALGEQTGDSLALLIHLADGSEGQVRGIRSHDGMVVEIEANPSLGEAVATNQWQRILLSVPADEDAMAVHHRTLVNAFHRITGFDRVMLYRFREDWAGEVIAEEAFGPLGSYLGLRFPASDIPAIARNLYLLNPSRLIPEVVAAPVGILSQGLPPPDLTWSELRSVSPVHLEYLRNMGVGASFSVPVRIAGQLWGLVACHHLTPRQLSPVQRQLCSNLTNAYALGVTSYIASRRLQMIDSLDRRTDRLLEALAQHDDPLDGIEANGAQFMEMLDASGFAMAVGDQVVIAGDGPDLEGMARVDHWFVNACPDYVSATNHLESLFPGNMLLLASASGLLAIKARSPRSGWVRFYWFRPQEPEEVQWAGNPNKPMVENSGAAMLSPRRSFERWVETKTGYSRPWSNEEKMTAAKFRNMLLRWL